MSLAGKGAERDPVEIRNADFDLRTAVTGDAASLLRILREPAVASWWGDFDAARVESELLGDIETIVIVESGRVIGFVQVSEEADPDYRHASLDIAIETASHGKGIGTSALHRIVSHLFNDRGHHRVTIDPRTDNAAAIASYTKVGFKSVGVMRQYERSGEGEWADGLLMDLVASEFDSGA